MNASLIRFILRCMVIVSASTVLVLALTESGTAGESAGACAGNANHYAQANWLQTAVRPLATFARFCSS